MIFLGISPRGNGTLSTPFLPASQLIEFFKPHRLLKLQHDNKKNCVTDIWPEFLPNVLDTDEESLNAIEALCE